MDEESDLIPLSKSWVIGQDVGQGEKERESRRETLAKYPDLNLESYKVHFSYVTSLYANILVIKGKQ